MQQAMKVMLLAFLCSCPAAAFRLTSRNSTAKSLVAKPSTSPSWACQLKDQPSGFHASGAVADASLKLHAHASDAKSLLVKAVDATSLSTMIRTAEADLLVVFYAPWCPHCQTYVMHDEHGNADKAPLELLAKELASHEGVKVLKYDINEHKPPVGFPLEHVPTIFMKSKNRAQPTEFQGDPHDLANLKQWVLQGGPTPPPQAGNQVVVLNAKGKA